MNGTPRMYLPARKLGRLSLIVLVPFCIFAPRAASEGKSNAVLDRYPSTDQFRARIGAAKTASASQYAATREDFGRAIWARFGLEGPNMHREESPHHVDPGPRLAILRTREEMLTYLDKLEQMEGGAEPAKFCRHHIEDLCFDDTPELPLVLVEILLDGWKDWSDWKTDRLRRVREEFPELHRVYAVRQLIRLKYNDVNGLLLTLYVDGDIPPYLWTNVRRALGELDGHFDKMEFTVDLAYSTDDVRVRKRLAGEVRWLATKASDDPRFKPFWEKYLQSSIPQVRFIAREAHGLPVPTVTEQLYAQEEWVAHNDPDPTRRKEMARVIRRREILRKRQEGTLTPEEWEQWRRESRSP